MTNSEFEWHLSAYGARISMAMGTDKGRLCGRVVCRMLTRVELNRQLFLNPQGSANYEFGEQANKATQTGQRQQRGGE